MNIALDVAPIILSIAALAVSLLRRRRSRAEELRIIGEESVAVAVLKAHDGISVERLALETALLIDLRDGKKDFTRDQLWAAVQAALSRRQVAK